MTASQPLLGRTARVFALIGVAALARTRRLGPGARAGCRLRHRHPAGRGGYGRHRGPGVGSHRARLRPHGHRGVGQGRLCTGHDRSLWPDSTAPTHAQSCATRSPPRASSRHPCSSSTCRMGMSRTCSRGCPRATRPRRPRGAPSSWARRRTTVGSSRSSTRSPRPVSPTTGRRAPRATRPRRRSYGAGSARVRGHRRPRRRDDVLRR